MRIKRRTAKWTAGCPRSLVPPDYSLEALSAEDVPAFGGPHEHQVLKVAETYRTAIDVFVAFLV